MFQSPPEATSGNGVVSLSAVDFPVLVEVLFFFLGTSFFLVSSLPCSLLLTNALNEKGLSLSSFGAAILQAATPLSRRGSSELSAWQSMVYCLPSQKQRDAFANGIAS